MITLKYIQDESVHSWIYRNIYVSGGLDFSTVIRPNGQWRVFPTFKDNMQFDKKAVDDLDFLTFVRKSGLAKKLATIYDNPVDYLSDLEKIFDRKLSSLTSVKGFWPIRFCHFCIQDAIKKYGFSYFKASWLSEYMCDIHSINLYELNKLGYSHTVSVLSNLLQGVNISSDLFFQASSKTAMKSKQRFNDYHIMPCFLRDFYTWAFNTRNERPPYNNFRWFYYADGRRKKPDKGLLYTMHTHFTLEHPQQYNDFFSNTFEIKEYQFGFAQSCSLSEKLLKSRYHNCSKCNHWGNTCPIQPIAMEPLEPNSFSSRIVNPCDFFIEHQIHKKSLSLIGPKEWLS